MHAPTELTVVSPQPVASKEPTGLGCLVIVAQHHGMHLTVSQLIHDNVLTGDELSAADVVHCARSVGLKAKQVRLDWDGLAQLNKALPAIARLTSGRCLVVRRVEGNDQGEDTARVVLQDPNAHEDAPLVIDRVRFEEAWTGDIILVKRNYDITDETQPFSIQFIAALIFRERWLVRDVAICALVLGFISLTPILFWRVLSDKVLYYKAYDTFFVICTVFLVFVVFEAAFTWLRQFLVLFLTSRVDVKMSTYVFAKVLDLPMDFFERNPVGQIAYHMNQIYHVRTFLVGQLFGTILDSATLIFFIPVMLFFSPAMTAAVVGMGALMVIWLLVWLPIHRRKANAVELAESEKGTFLAQSLFGARTVKSLALDARQRRTWDVHVARVTKLRFAEGMTANMIQSGVKPLERLAVSGSFALGVYLAITSTDTAYVGALFAFMMLSQRVVGPLLQMAQLVNQYDEARIAVEVVAHLVNQPAEEGRSGHGVRTPLGGQVEFSKVTFTYKGAATPALKDVAFEVPEGTTLGIVGRSGSGKTTVTRLLQRLHSNYDGLIKIGGIDVREFDVDHLRRSLGVVLQENFLFSGTIRENIMMAKSDATYDEVVRAARLAGAEEFIDKLPRGYETYVYEGSPNLSGGQRQRLAIARALIVDPRILIFDEATSALDPESEAIVSSNIARIGRGRTLIIISHRLSSLVASDAILVMERGGVADVGRHEELLKRCEIYGELWYQQNRHLTAPAVGRKVPQGGPSLVS